MVQLSHPYVTTRKTIALTIQTFAGKVMSLLFNMLSRFVISCLPRWPVSTPSNHTLGGYVPQVRPGQHRLHQHGNCLTGETSVSSLLLCFQRETEAWWPVGALKKLLIQLITACCVLCCAKSLQSCLTLGDPIDCGPPGSSVHGILQAKILE